MRVLMIADRAFSTRENRMLTRLEVALADEGIRVARACPEGFAPESSASFAATFEYEAPSPLISTASRAARLLQRTAKNPDWAAKHIDAIHVWGENAWPLAAAVAKKAHAALVVEMWSHRFLTAAKRFERRIARTTPLVWIAPGGHTAEALRLAGSRARCRVAPWGAHAADKPTTFSDPIRPVSAAVLATGRDAGSVAAALEGLALAARRHEELLIFLDAVAVKKSHDVWKRLRAQQTLDRVSLMPDLESRREPALHADLFIRPEESAEHRSVVLDAMAAGMCVISHTDPVVEALQADQTCLMCHEPNALGWEHAILRALDEPHRARTIGANAQQYIRESQSVFMQANALMDAYEDIASTTTTAA